MKFNVRNLTKDDYKILVEWWDWGPGWVAPPQTFTTIDGKEVPDMYDWNESNQSWDKKPTDYPSL